VNQIETDSGLRYRLRRAARQVGEQHRRIGEIYLELGTAVANRTKPDAMQALLRYQEALEAHFRLEEEVFFPAIHGLEPTRESELGELRRTHERLRKELCGLVEAAVEVGPEAFSEWLHRFAKQMAVHESHEEELLERINSIAPPASEKPPIADPTR